MDINLATTLTPAELIAACQEYTARRLEAEYNQPLIINPEIVQRILTADLEQ